MIVEGEILSIWKPTSGFRKWRVSVRTIEGGYIYVQVRPDKYKLMKRYDVGDLVHITVHDEPDTWYMKSGKKREFTNLIVDDVRPLVIED